MTQAVTFGRRGTAAPQPSRVAPSQPAPRSPMAQAAPSDEEDSLATFFLKLLFSFKGRLDRRTYRLCRIVANVGYLLIVYGVRDAMPKLVGNPAMALLFGLVMIGLSVVMIWSTLAMQVKRRHDRDKSWPWLFVGFIPIIGPFWVLVECCWLDGTPGYNRFDDPSKTAAATFA
jgi:uncharacterized membrane protein YhaH (DUF805 family)